MHYSRLRIRATRLRRNELAPIHTLPVEVFQTIFQLHLADEYDTSRLVMNQEDAMHPPVDFEHSPADKVHRATQRIAMVCNRWYDMVISMPQLWSYLDATRSIETTTLRLRRSGRRFMELIVPLASRWKTFITHNSRIFESVDLQPYSAPLLEQFVIPSLTRSNRSQLPTMILERAPNLRSS
ncbi:hypothetical protein FRC02_005579 [Tulasnella sp. 418]|nr:hypothetical protein FRC02_005579 [Tulasnella sp. 418]